MTIVYVTTGAWGSGSGSPNSAAQVDGNFWDVDQRVVNLVADLAEGKRIDTVTYTSNSMTFHFTDGTSQVIPLPIATITYVGPWANNMPLSRGNLISAPGLGMYQVLQDHITPAPPAIFDPGATGTDLNPLYQLWFPLTDVNYDAAIFVPGTLQREPDELLFQGIANRAMRLHSGDDGAYAYLETGTAAADIVLSIEKNGSEIGVITFVAGDADSDGGQRGEFNIPADVDFAASDSYALRVTQSDDAEPSDLSVTLPFLRTDI